MGKGFCILLALVREGDCKRTLPSELRVKQSPCLPWLSLGPGYVRRLGLRCWRPRGLQEGSGRAVAAASQLPR